MKVIHHCTSLNQCLQVARKMYLHIGLLYIAFVCLIPNGQCSPHLRTFEDRQFDFWEQPSGDIQPGKLPEEQSESPLYTNEHHTTTGVDGKEDRDVVGILTNKQQVGISPLSRVSIPSPGEAGLLSSSMVRITGDPLPGEEDGGLLPDLRHQNRPVADVIRGSRRAFSITKLEYLKKEWCKTERFRQVIREEGCLKRVIINRFCYGQCNSFFIPKSNRNDPDWAAFKSCAFCKPRKASNITVTLVCPNRRPRLKRKKILVVKECRCMAQSLD